MQFCERSTFHELCVPVGVFRMIARFSHELAMQLQQEEDRQASAMLQQQPQQQPQQQQSRQPQRQQPSTSRSRHSSAEPKKKKDVRGLVGIQSFRLPYMYSCHMYRYLKILLYMYMFFFSVPFYDEFSGQLFCVTQIQTSKRAARGSTSSSKV